MQNTLAFPRLGMLSHEQCETVHHASLEILRRTGVRVYHDEALELLRRRGGRSTLVLAPTVPITSTPAQGSAARSP
jgi:trimethylamine:corrinoid methyltransferase-like protein